MQKKKNFFFFSRFSHKKSTLKFIKINSFNNHWLRQSLYLELNYNPLLKISGVEPTPNLWPTANSLPENIIPSYCPTQIIHEGSCSRENKAQEQPASCILFYCLLLVLPYFVWCSLELLQIICILNFSWLPSVVGRNKSLFTWVMKTKGVTHLT